MEAWNFIRNSKRFEGMNPFEELLEFSSPTMHGREMKYVSAACEKNQMGTEGENVDELERLTSEFTGVNYAAAFSSGTAAMHLAVKLAAERLYHSSSGISTPSGLGAAGTLYGRRVFCSDMAFASLAGAVVCEGGEPVFIDSEYETWNMDPEALDRAFEIYSDVRLVILTHIYGMPAKVDEIKSICRKYDALLIEDASGALGTEYKGRKTGSFGDYGVLSFSGSKIITGSCGGMLLADDRYSIEKARKWSAHSCENAPWNQHEELGYNYRMSNITAGIVRGQWEYLKTHIEMKKKIYSRYKEAFAQFPIDMNPYDEKDSSPNFWISCLTVDESGMDRMQRSECETMYESMHGRSSPGEILEALSAFHAKGCPVLKPMHLQPLYRNHDFITVEGSRRVRNGFYIRILEPADVGADLFQRGVCLPSDIKMTEEQQNQVIEIISRCFQ